MKIRHGFVSNSSSSSFVCDVCGAECSGMDMCLSDAEMYRCENDHTFCDSHMIKGKKVTDDDADEEDEEDYDERYDAPEAICPICNMNGITRNDLIAYLLREVGLTEKQILIFLKHKYQPDGFVAGAYKQFAEDIYPKKEKK